MQTVCRAPARLHYFAGLLLLAVIATSFILVDRAHAITTHNVSFSSDVGGASTTWTITFTPIVETTPDHTVLLYANNGVEAVQFSDSASDYQINGMTASGLNRVDNYFYLSFPETIPGGVPATITASNTSNLAPGTHDLYVSVLTTRENLSTNYTATVIFKELEPPGGLALASLGSSSIALAWDAADGASGYYIYRDGIRLNDTPVSEASYTADGLEPGGSYSFAVASVNAAGESAASAPLPITTPPLLDLQDMSGHAGATVQLPLTIDYVLPTDPDAPEYMAAIEFDLKYDPEFLTFIPPVEGTTDMQYHEVEPGFYRIVIGSPAKTALYGQLGYVGFAIGADNRHLAMLDVTLSGIIAANRHGNTWILPDDAAIITAIDAAPPTLAVVLSTTEFAPVVYATIDSDGTGSDIAVMKWAYGELDLETVKSEGTDFTGPLEIRENGTYTFYVEDAAGNGAIAAITVDNILIKGDINGDGKVDLFDWQATANFILRIAVPNERERVAADINGDLAINVGDWVRIADILLTQP